MGKTVPKEGVASSWLLVITLSLLRFLGSYVFRANDVEWISNLVLN